MPLYANEYNSVLKGFTANSKQTAKTMATNTQAQSAITKAQSAPSNQGLVQHLASLPHADLLHHVVHAIGTAGTAIGQGFERNAARAGVSGAQFVNDHTGNGPQHIAGLPDAPQRLPNNKVSKKLFGPNQTVQSYQQESKQHGGGLKGAVAATSSAAGDATSVAGPGSIVKGGAVLLGIRATKAAEEAATVAKATRLATAGKNVGKTARTGAQRITDPARLLPAPHQAALIRINDLEKEKHLIMRNPTLWKAPEKTMDNLGTDSQAKILSDAKFQKNAKNGMPVVKSGTTMAENKTRAVSGADRLREINRQQKELNAAISADKVAPPIAKTIMKEATPSTVTHPTKLTTEAEAEKNLSSIAGATAPLAKGGKVSRAVQGTKNTLASKVTAIHNIGTPSAKELAQSVRNVDTHHQGLRAQYEQQIPTVLKLGKNDVGHFWNSVEKGVAPINDKVKQATQEWKALSPQIRQDATDAGVKVGHVQNYLPRSYDWKAIEKNPAKYDEILQKMVDTGGAKTKVEAHDLIQQFKNNTGGPSRFGHFESARKLDIPGNKQDIHTIRNYIDLAAKRTAEATHLGAGNEKAVNLINNIAKEKGNHILARDAVRNYLHPPDVGGLGKKAGTVRSIYGAARLGTAAVSHAGQTSNVAVRAGVGRTVKNIAQVVNPSHRQFAVDSGVLHPNELHGLAEQQTGITGNLSKVTAPLLTKVMKFNRIVAANAGRDYGKALAAKGDIAGLRKLNVKGDIGKTLTQEQEYQAARGVTNDTMFNRSRAATPIKAETTTGKFIGQYRLAYGFKQTGFIYKHVLQEAKNGNIQPLVRFMATSAPVAGGTVAIKNKISGRKQGPGGKLADALGALGGLPGELAVQTARYGKKYPAETVAGAVAPIAGESLKIANAADQYAKGNKKPAGQYVAGLVPVKGKAVSEHFFPTSSETSRHIANEGSPELTKELASIKYTPLDSSRKTDRAKALDTQDYKLYTHASSGLFADRAQQALQDSGYQNDTPAGKKARMAKVLTGARADVLDQMIGKPKKGSSPKYPSYR